MAGNAGRFGLASEFAAGTGAYDTVVAEFTGDATGDLVVAGSGQDRLTVLHGTC